jgi:small subunit ribosomal protein S16
MLVIRLQRIGRSGHAQFRVVVQDAHQSPKSGKTVALLGSYDPHTKDLKVDIDKLKTYMQNGAQPSNRVIVLLKKEGVKLPSWVLKITKKQKPIRHTDKLRKNRPAEAEVAEPAEEVTEATEEAVEATEEAVEATEEVVAEEATPEVEVATEEKAADEDAPKA